MTGLQGRRYRLISVEQNIHTMKERKKETNKQTNKPVSFSTILYLVLGNCLPSSPNTVNCIKS
jgi:hypothetical protein